MAIFFLSKTFWYVLYGRDTELQAATNLKLHTHSPLSNCLVRTVREDHKVGGQAVLG